MNATQAMRNLRHIRECIAEADATHTPQQLHDADCGLAEIPQARQPSLFNEHAAHAGVATCGQPSPIGCGAALTRGARGKHGG